VSSPMKFGLDLLGSPAKIALVSRSAWSLAPGDTLFLCSDGLVEAKSSRSEEPFGFERLEASLSRYVQGGVEALRDGILADITRFTGDQPREDDQTLLVLRLP